MAGKVLSLTKRLDHDERLDRLRAYYSGMSYQDFIKQRVKLREQAERILKSEKRAH